MELSSGFDHLRCSLEFIQLDLGKSVILDYSANEKIFCGYFSGSSGEKIESLREFEKSEILKVIH